MSLVPNVSKYTEPTQTTAGANRQAGTWKASSDPVSKQQDARRHNRLTAWSRTIIFVLVIVELGILLRMVLKVVAVATGNPILQFMYQFSDPFFVPFAGFTFLPGVTGSIREIPAIIVTAALGVLALLILRVPGAISKSSKAFAAAKNIADL